MYNTTISETYYILDRLAGTFTTLSNRQDFIHHLAEKCVHWYKRGGTHLNAIKNEQNLTGNDTTRFSESKCHYTEDGNYVYDYRVWYALKRFTFYRQYNKGPINVISIEPYIAEIEEEKSNFYRRANRNWCKERRYKPYQLKSHMGKANRYQLDPELETELAPSSRRQSGKDFHDPYDHYCSKSERCWKKQTKNKHQHGNDTRNKHLESYYGYFGNDIDRIEYEKNIDTLLTEDFMAA